MKGYHQFANSLMKAGNIKKPVLKKSENVSPSGLSLWALGKDNEIGMGLIPQLKILGVDLKKDDFNLKEGYFSFKEHSFVFTLPHSINEKDSITWLIASSEKSIPGLIRKLPHYGKYGYLVFKGDAPENVVKGVWPSIPVGMQKKFSDRKFSLSTERPLVNFQMATEH